jgi:exopolysaccharide production protein ExoZ
MQENFSRVDFTMDSSGTWFQLPSALLLAAVTLCTTQAKSGTINRSLAMLGDASYRSTCFIPSPCLLFGTVSIWLFDFTQAPWLATILIVLGSIAVSLIVYRYFERPATRLLQTRIKPIGDTRPATNPG